MGLTNTLIFYASWLQSLMAYSHCTNRKRDWYRSKQWVLVFPYLGPLWTFLHHLLERIDLILGPLAVQCEYTINPELKFPNKLGSFDQIVSDKSAEISKYEINYIAFIYWLTANIKESFAIAISQLKWSLLADSENLNVRGARTVRGTFFSTLRPNINFGQMKMLFWC